jgi:hypothetical protein
MSYKAIVFKVMIASPGDVIEERGIIREALYEWNSVHSATRKILLTPTGWDTDSTPEMGDRPQAIINDRLLKDCDLLVAVFWTRIGTATGNAVSGTVEEIEEHLKAGKPAMIYFSNTPVEPDKVHPVQYSALKQFRIICEGKGLVEAYQSTSDFRNKFSRQLAAKINQDEYFVVRDVDNEFGGINFNPPDSPIGSLSKMAKLILKEVAQDPEGFFRMMNNVSGKMFISNGKQFVKVGDPKSRAVCEAAVEELVNFQPSLLALDITDSTGTILKITKRGFEVAEQL